MSEYRISRSLSDASTFFMRSEKSPSSLPRHGFTRFEEKKRHNKEVKNTPVKSLFRKTPTRQDGHSSKQRRALSPESHASTQDFGQFLQKIPQTAAHHAYTFLKSHIEKLDQMVSAGVLSPLDISERFHIVYQTLSDKVKDHVAYTGNLYPCILFLT